LARNRRSVGIVDANLIYSTREVIVLLIQTLVKVFYLLTVLLAVYVCQKKSLNNIIAYFALYSTAL
jgi:hypothetical protein